jgi:hypothetical protein
VREGTGSGDSASFLETDERYASETEKSTAFFARRMAAWRRSKPGVLFAPGTDHRLTPDWQKETNFLTWRTNIEWHICVNLDEN